MLSLGTMSIECLDKFVIYVARKTTSWISLILFPALLYCHLLNVELRHNVDGVPRQLCTLPTTPRFTCPHFPSLAFVPFPSASSACWHLPVGCFAENSGCVFAVRTSKRSPGFRTASPCFGRTVKDKAVASGGQPEVDQTNPIANIWAIGRSRC